MKINDIINEALKRNASDIHLVSGQPPFLRTSGELAPLPAPPFDTEALNNLILGMLNEEQKATLFQNKELDFSYRLKDYQFRVNVCFSEGALAANIRITAAHISTLEELRLPLVINELCMKRKGLVLISGTAGSGKTTTLTYMVNLINKKRKCKIVTIEDPIEYYHKSENSVILQREVGADTNSFGDALKYALRQDPDVLVVGEMRDLESIAMALTSAETGHLVFTTVHASDAIETINRLVDVFPMDRRQQIHSQLAGNLLAVISQSLIPTKSGEGRALATEIMISNVAIQNLIHRGALNEIRGQMDSDENTQSHSLERSMADMIKKNVITREAALQFTKNVHALDYFLRTGATTDPETYSKIPWDVIHAKSIIILDHHVEDRVHMEATLKKKGFKNVAAIPKNKESLERIAKGRPDIVVLDMEYEFMEAVAFCKAIKALPHHPKIIMVAQDLQSNDSFIAQSAGADGYVVKTQESELLIKAITKLHF